jgi:ParB-like chromosome segregation protein Spo0J
VWERTTEPAATCVVSVCTQKVIAGHGRLLAACKRGWDTVSAIRLSHLTESQGMAFLIADNRLTENSSWDELETGN